MKKISLLKKMRFILFKSKEWKSKIGDPIGSASSEDFMAEHDGGREHLAR